MTFALLVALLAIRPVTDLRVESWKMPVRVAAVRTYRCTMPRTLAWGESCTSDTLARSSMVVELWAQQRRSVWAPDDWRVWAAEWSPYLLAVSAPGLPGSAVVVTAPEQLPGTTVWAVARGPGGARCVSNAVDGR